ncbi:hypothetical protein LB507_006693 [Fusarium sp. FIESC RH6]|nr:hypothetical protein LB507_006693 [Fusarium sp. FIESC RH6]
MTVLLHPTLTTKWTSTNYIICCYNCQLSQSCCLLFPPFNSSLSTKTVTKMLAPILTTRDTPIDIVCFNLTDTFSPGNKSFSGIQKAYRPWEDRNSNVSYYLEQNDFDSSANYTQIRYALPGMDPGEERAQWVLWTYPHLNCETVLKDVDRVEFPWYEVDCQIEEDGECQQVSHPIKSFAILKRDRKGDSGKTWAQLGSATKTTGQVSRVLSATVAVAISFLIL